MGNNAARVVRFGAVESSQESVAGASRIFRFGIFELDLRARELRRQGSKVKLQEQPFQVLAQLLEKPGEVVSRDELQARLWPADTFVDFDHSLNAAIRRVRDALGDSAENPRFVETVARRGYRFLAPVTRSCDQAVIHPVSTNGSHSPVGSAMRYRALLGIAIAAAVALVLVGIRVGSSLSHAGSTGAPWRISQLTSNPAEDRVEAAAISRDGKYLAFSDDTGFYLRQIDSGETHPVQLPNGLKVESINWSPDSVHMVLGLSGDAQGPSLWVISTLGGEARKLNEDGNFPAVSPDGSEIAFIAGKPLHQQIWLGGADGSRQRKLAGVEGDFFGALAWSPDGRQLAYTRGRPATGYGVNGVIEIVDVHSTTGAGTPSILKSMALTGLEGSLAWTSDGRLLYVVVEPPPHEGDSNVWSVPLDERGSQLAPPVRLTNDSGKVLGISVTSDGKRIALIKGRPEPDVYVAGIETSGSISEPQRLTLDDRLDIPWDWTADNKAVIFISDRTGTTNIYRQAIDQTVPELLVRGSNPVETRLSPDGSQILYVEFPKWGETHAATPLMRVPLAGGAPQMVLKDEWISNHQCARAPASICLYSLIGDRKVTFFTYDPFKGKGTQVFQFPAESPQLFNWSLSPDGTALAIAHGKPGKWMEQEPRIHLVSVKDGSDRWLAIKGLAGIGSLDWAADSKSFWAVSPGEKNALFNIDLQGHVRTVWRPEKKSVAWAIPSRDGKYLALHVGSNSSNAWMLERP